MWTCEGSLEKIRTSDSIPMLLTCPSGVDNVGKWGFVLFSWCGKGWC